MEWIRKYILRPVVRWLIITVMKLLYNVRVIGLDHIPASGGALLAGNHESYLDAAMVLVFIKREVRFLISDEVANAFWIRPLVRLTRAIPLVRTVSPRAMLESLHKANEAAANGELIALFPEGQVTRLGIMLPFRRGYERVLKSLELPIIPFAVDGCYETVFSLRPRKLTWSAFLRRRRIPLTLIFGPPVSKNIEADQLRLKVQELQARAFVLRRDKERPLGETLALALRQNKSHQTIDGDRHRRIASRCLLEDALIIARHLNRHHGHANRIGISTRQNIYSVTAVLGVLFSGKTVVPLTKGHGDYSMETDAIISDRDLYAIVNQATIREKLSAKVTSTLLPTRRVLPRRVSSVDCEAFCLEAAGAVSHWNIVGNVRMIAHCLRFDETTVILSTLSHASLPGLLAGLVLPVLSGIPVVICHDRKNSALGACVAKYGCTHLVTTADALRSMMHQLDPALIGSIRSIICVDDNLSAEELKAFRDKFGLQPFGILAEERMGILALSVRDLRLPGVYQKGWKPASMGRALPGVAIRIVNDTGEPTPENQPGRVQVLAAHRFTGDAPEWVDLDRRGHLDDEGFLFFEGIGMD